MGKSTFFYFRKGAKLSRRFHRGNTPARISGFFYFIARAVAMITLLPAPLFAQSSFTMSRMLNETGDAIFSKSFDGAEDRKSYFALLLFYLLVLGVTVAVGASLFLIWFYGFRLISYTIVVDESRFIYQVIYSIVIGFLAIVALLVVAVTAEAGGFIYAKNKSLGVGDIAYNAVKYTRDHGGKLFLVNLLHALSMVVWLAIWFIAAFVFETLSKQGGDMSRIYYVIGTLCTFVGFIWALLFLSSLGTAWMVSVNLLMLDTCDTSKYVVIYGKKDEVDPVTHRGRYIEITPLYDEEGRPLDVVGETKEDK